MFCRKTNEKQLSIQEEKEKVEVEVEDENDIDADEERRSRRRRRKRGEFVNILAINHQPNMTKPYKPLMAYNIENPLDPQSLKRYILATEKMEQIVEYFAKKTQQKPEEIRKQVKRILDEIGLDRNLAIIRWCGIAITYISTRITRGIYIHEEHIERLKRNLGSHPVLYLPSHRSYMDFILMSYVFFHYDIEIPGITAGMDFHGMYGIGNMLRKTGAFFMRRTFTDGHLYWDVFREYVFHLVSHYHIGVEFFVEGTRSRNFKALTPKIGLLSMALKPFIMGMVSDIIIIPIGISYERCTEEQLFIYELLGVPKPKESTRGFFKALRIMDEQFGRIYIDFGKPISVKSFLTPDLDRLSHTTIAAHLQTLQKNELESIKRLANEVVHQQQQHIMLHLFNVLCLCFANRLYAKGQRSQRIDKLLEDVKRLRYFLKQLETPLTVDLLQSVEWEQLKMNAMETLRIHSNTFLVMDNDNDDSGKIQLISISIEHLIRNVDPGKMKAHPLQPLTMSIAIPSLSLQLYVNPCLYWLARPAYLLLAALKLQKEQHFLNPGTLKDQLKKYAYELEDIFKYEFIIDAESQEKEFYRNLQILEMNDILHINSDRNDSFKQISVNLDNVCCQALLTTLTPFLCLYYQLLVTLHQELRNKETILTNMEILRRLQKRIESIILRQPTMNQESGDLRQPSMNQESGELNGKHVHPYCLALDNINVAIHSLVQDGYLIKQRDLNTLQLSGQKSLHELEQRLLVYCDLIPFRQYFIKDDQQQQQQREDQEHSSDQYEATKLISKL